MGTSTGATTLSFVLQARQSSLSHNELQCKRIQMYRNCKPLEIVSSYRHNPRLLHEELIKFVQNPSITNFIKVDYIKRCTHVSSLHVFIVTSTKNEDVSNINIPITIQSVR